MNHLRHGLIALRRARSGQLSGRARGVNLRWPWQGCGHPVGLLLPLLSLWLSRLLWRLSSQPFSLLMLLALLFAAAAHADVTVVNTRTAVNSTSSPTSITLALPTGSQPGDLLVAHLAVRAGITVTAPAGWTTVLGPSTRDNVRHQIWYRTVPALSLGSQTWTFGSGSRAVAGMISLRGVDGANPIAASASNTGNSATATAPSLTSSSAGSYLLAFFSGDDGNTAMANGTVANSSGWSFASGGGTGSGVTGALFHRALPTIGGSGTSQASAPNDWIASTVIVNAGAGLSCYNDQFTRTSLGTDWAVGSSSGSFGSPQIVSNRLRMTNASSNVATAATLQRLFPTTGNFIQIEFTLHDYGGSGADGIAIILSDATIAPVPGGYGGSLGYAQRSGVNGFAGGWLGVGLDEYGNYSSASEGRVGGSGFVADAVAVRGSGSGTGGYRFVAGSGGLTPGVDGTPAAGHRYRITINAAVAGTVSVNVERDTAGTGAYSSLVSVANILTATGQAALPANLIFSITGSTGGSTNIHEVDDLGVCASQINAMAQFDHVRFVTDADALTCQPESITMYACNDSSCSSLYTGATSISLTPSSNWVSGNVASFSGGSTSKSLQRTSAGTVAIGVSGSTPSAVNPARCFTGGPPGGTEISCNVLFRDSGFAFDVPNLTANKLATAIKVRAVRKDLITQQCTPAFSGNRQVFWYGRYQNPTTGSLPVFISDPNESQNISTVNNAAAAPAGTAFTHVFDSNGETEINVRYADAGQLQLNASYTGSAGTGDAGLSLTGNDSFVSVPAGFCVEAMRTAAPTLPYFDLTDAVARNGCTSAACAAYQRAGVNFPLRVRAMAWQNDSEIDADFCPELPAAVSPTNALTPNFAGAVSLSAELPVETPTDSALLDNASLAQTSATLAAGTVTLSNQQFSEVGRFRIRTGGTYLGAALPTTASLRIGRITPNRYNINVSAYESACVDAITPANSFSYAGLSGGTGKAGQAFSLTASVDAMNGATPAARSRNYSAGYATLNGSSLTLNDFSGGVVATDGAFSAIHSLTFTEGNAIAAPASASYLFNSARAPYPIALEASATDSDGVTGSSARTSEIGFRLGRMVLENAYGPEQLPLPIPLRAEYFDGSRWRRNSLDNCSSYASSVAARDQFTGTLSDALTTFDSPSGSQLVQTGIAQTSQPLRIQAPGLGNWGSLRVQLTVPSWLQFDWDADGSQNDQPTAVATFGRYRGSDRVIYWRERLPVIP